ncbi:MAG: RES family NAD+ phosphorylase [Flavobacteriaceae bacterium]|nr:RES family NAD+ phosphorylase [Flavobacteriaceae bacterium]
MRVFRIERERYLKDTLRGIGVSLSDGSRWNSFGTFLVYTAESRALAMLEVSVHLDLRLELPSDRLMVEIEIADSVKILEISRKDLPKNWNAKPPSKQSQFIGNQFVRYNEAAVLKIPSSLVEKEFNYLINPNHSESSKIKVIGFKAFNFYQRLKN